MSQITHGLRSVLSASAAYDFFQNLVGAESFRRTIVSDHLRVGPNSRILDIGCGTAEILRYLPEDVEYHGFDASEAYIETARQRFGHRGTFARQLLTDADLAHLPRFDLVLAIGLLHHLSDAEASQLFEMAAKALRPDGRVCTVDPCLEQGQSIIARAVIRRDRGQNVRTLEGYRELATPHFGRVEARTRTDLLRIPYTHALLSCASPRTKQ